MGENKYQRVDLGEDFFLRVEIIISNHNGDLKYVWLFTNLIFLSVNTDGWFITKDGEWMMPWTPKTIYEEILGFSVKEIREGIDVLLKAGLIEKVDGLLRISDFERYINLEH